MFVAGEMRYTTDSALASYADQFGATITHCDLGGTDQIDIEDLRTLPPTAAELQTQDTRTFLCCEPSGSSTSWGIASGVANRGIGWFSRCNRRTYPHPEPEEPPG